MSNLIPMDTRDLRMAFLSGALVNARSLVPKRTDIEEYILSRDLEMCLVTETWIKTTDAEVAVQEIAPDGYGILSHCRVGPSRGGDWR